MKIFLDTSALVKIYSSEVNSQEVRNTISNSRIFIGEITILEFHSAIYKKERMKVLTKADSEEIFNQFNIDISDFEIIKINKDIWKSSVKLIHTYYNIGLRSLDALQIACAISQTNFHQIISYDNVFNEVLIKESLI